MRVSDAKQRATDGRAATGSGQRAKSLVSALLANVNSWAKANFQQRDPPRKNINIGHGDVTSRHKSKYSNIANMSTSDSPCPAFNNTSVALATWNLLQSKRTYLESNWVRYCPSSHATNGILSDLWSLRTSWACGTSLSVPPMLESSHSTGCQVLQGSPSTALVSELWKARHKLL
jgi:hypothetical protein